MSKKETKKANNKEDVENKPHETKTKKEELKEKRLEELKHTKNKTFFTAMHHALDGVIRAFKTERNLRIDYIIGLFVLICSLFFDFTKTEFACLCLTIGFVIFAEMINSTVEYIVDLITDKYDDRAKAAKDIAAGGVLISSIVAVVVAFFLFVSFSISAPGLSVRASEAAVARAFGFRAVRHLISDDYTLCERLSLSEQHSLIRRVHEAHDNMTLIV